MMIKQAGINVLPPILIRVINAADNQYSIVYSGLQHQTDEQMAHHPQIVWVEMKQFLAANMALLHKVDSLTRLPLFMLATVGESRFRVGVQPIGRVPRCNIYLKVINIKAHNFFYTISRCNVFAIVFIGA